MSQRRFGAGVEASGDVPAILVHHATLQAFDAATYLATVLIERSPDAALTLVPVSRGVAAAQMVVGRVVCLIVFDALNLADAMIVGVF